MTERGRRVEPSSQVVDLVPGWLHRLAAVGWRLWPLSRSGSS